MQAGRNTLSSLLTLHYKLSPQKERENYLVTPIKTKTWLQGTTTLEREKKLVTEYLLSTNWQQF